MKKTLQLVGVLFVCFVGFLLFSPTTTFAQVTLSGTLYADAGVTPQAASKFIAVAVGTSTPTTFSTTTLTTTGAWTLTIPAGHGISSGTPIMVWVNDDVTFRATVLTKASSSATVQNITGLDLYQNRVIVRHEATSGTSTTNADFGFYTSTQDSDLQHSTSTGLLTIAASNELYVWPGDTFAPGGDVTVAGDAGSSATEGSFYLDASSIYTAGGALRLAGSLNVVSTATFTGGIYTTTFIATTTGKIINAPVTTLGNVTFDGLGGAWAFTSAATTSAFTVLSGTVTAPASTLGVTGTFQNDATFLHNGGVINIAGAATVALGDIARYVAGRDNSGSAAGTQNLQVNTMVVNGNFLYIGKAGNATACSNVAGSAVGCELMVFDVSSTTNPTYIVGRDVTGNAAGTGNLGINSLIVMGNYLYVGKPTNATACSNTAGSALGCELMVFDISSTTNPTYIVGRDSTGSAAGVDGTTGITNFATSSNMLYVSKTGSATACSQVAGSAVGCELMVFDVSSTTNPTYIAGRDVSGSAAGTQNLAINQIMALGSQLYVVKAANATACSQTAGSAVGCELMIYDISSTTNPTYIAGRDATGSATGTGNLGVTGLYAVNGKVYIGKAGDITVCSQIAGSALGCELMIFDTSSTTNPIYVRGVDVAGGYLGVQTLAINNLLVRDNYLYAVNAASAIPCSQFTNQTIGCEILTFDISSSTAARLIAGRDAGGDSLGVQTLGATAVTSAGNSLFVSKGGSATACSNVAGSAIGCELMIFDVTTKAQGVLMGSLLATSSLGNLQATGVVEFRDSAQVGTITVASGTTTAPAELTVGGNFQNNAKFVANDGAVIFSSSSDQTVGGLLTASSSFYRVKFSGVGTTTFSNNASTTFIDIQSGTVVAPSLLTVSDTLNNNGTFANNGGHIQTQGYLNEFLYGLSAGGGASDAQGLAFNAFAQRDSILYAVKNGSATACSQVAGSAIGCELMVFNIASTTNPFYVAGRDASGNNAGTGNIAATQLTISGNYLYVSKAANNTACSNVAGSALGCEIMVFDISSTTNPVYVAGRDSSGSAAGTANLGVNQLVVGNGVLYAVKGADATACSQTAGSAIGCELIAFDIASTTNPIYVAGRDAGGNATGTQTLNTPSITLSGNSLYIAKAGSATACSNVVGSAVGCELMVFDISSTTNPVYVAGRDGTGSAAGAVSSPIQFIDAEGALLHVAKAGSATACSQAAGSATGCEYMIFNIASTTNPIYIAGRDVTGSAAGTGNVTANMVIATGTQAYLAKAGNATNCSQVVGSATGCELMMFDVSSTTNPLYALGRDSNSSLEGRSGVAVQSLQIIGGTLVVGKALDTIVCEQASGQRTGCELALYKIPTSLQGTLTDLSSLATVTTNGITEINSSASTTNVFVASSSMLIAPTTTLSFSEQLNVSGSYVNNGGELALTGTTNTITTYATTTFYDFTKRATAAATTTFSTVAPFVIEHNLTLSGTTSAPLKLRSSNGGTAWKIDPQSSTTIIARYLDVQDSNNISATTTTLICDLGCFDSGNNTNWEFTPASAALEWSPAGWTLFETITIDETNIDENLTDFPVYVDLANLSSSFWTTTPAGATLVGTDIRVTTSDNVEVPRELVFASSTIDTGELHFKAPLVSATEDTVFKIWYNGTTTGDYADDATYGAENVWTNNFLAVYHMQQDPTGTTTDSTSNNYDAYPRGGSFASNALVSGAVGSAVNFDGSDAIDVTNFTSHLSSFAVESWIRPTALENTGNFYTLIDLKDAVYLGVRDTNESVTAGTNWTSFYTWNTATSTVVDDQFQHLYVEFDDMTDTATDPVFTNNGNSVTYTDNTPAGTHIQPTTNLYIGSAFGFDPFIGDIDELRISSTTRSFAWRRATYLNQATTTSLTEVNKSVGSSTLTAHTAGQAADAFSAADKTNESLFAFRMTPNSGTATVTAVTLALSGVSNVVDTDFSNIRLYRDADSDGQYDATEVAVGGAGVMSIAEGVGSITFTTDFLATTSLDYIVVANFAAPSNGSFMTISLSPGQIAVTDTNVVHIVLGSVEPVQHSRNSRSGGGGSSSVGDPAPAGAGDVGGGGDTGGEVIGNNPDFVLPTSNSGSWNNAGNAYDDTDGTYATTSSATNHSYSNHGFGIPGSNIIGGIVVKLEISGTTAAGTVNVELSWNGGTNWTSAKTTPTLTTSDRVLTLGSLSDLWGRAWTGSEFSNGNFAVRMTGAPSSNTIQLDAIQVRVYHTTGGGGAGGGGGI